MTDGDLCVNLFVVVVVVVVVVVLDSSCMSPYRAGSGSAIARVGP